MINKISPSLFSIANGMVRQNMLDDAICIYEFLREQNPHFSPYSINEKMARQKWVKEVGVKKAKTKYHYDKATEYQKRLRIADKISKKNDTTLVSICFDPKNISTTGEEHLAAANALVEVSHDSWALSVNQYLATHKLAPISLKKREQWIGNNLFLNLISSKLSAVEGPLVTVCMSCFNAEAYVELAVRSILNQSYRNIELFLFNDCSADGTLSILRRLEREDSRITVINNVINQGTYISRNQAFQRAKGEFFTIMDADDFALPERLAFQVEHLQKNSFHMGVLTEWVRMSEDGRFHFKGGWGGAYQHEAVATLMIRTHEPREKIGYWDSVRFAADTEFLFRMRKVYGDNTVPLLKVPSAISLYHEASLTNHPVNGINVNGIKGLSPTRIQYRRNWLDWHAESNTKIFMPFPLKSRLFDAPIEMLPEE